MKFKNTCILLIVLAGIICLVYWFLSGSNQEAFEIVDLGTLGGGNSYAAAANDIGQVVGYSEISPDSDEKHAFFWDKTSGMIDLGTLGGRFSKAYDLNNLGQVVGIAAIGNGERHAFVWDAANGMVDLGTLGDTISCAYGINDDGQVFGTFEADDGAIRIFVWEKNSGFIELYELGTVSGSRYRVRAFNDFGEAVGTSQGAESSSKYVTPFIRRRQKGKASGPEHAFRWKNGVMTDLEALGSAVSIPSDINNVGQIVGFSVNEDSPLRRACIWDEAGAVEYLGELGGLAELGREYMALGINNKDQIIGWCGYKHQQLLGPGWAWYWDRDSGMTKLDELLVDDKSFERLVGAEDISDCGQIVGYGKARAGKTHAFVMTPISKCTKD